MPTAPPDDSPRRPLVLVAEDDRDFRKLLVFALEQAGYVVDGAVVGSVRRRVPIERVRDALALCEEALGRDDPTTAALRDRLAR